MLELCPVTLKAANEYVKEHHRHHGVVVGHKFSIGAARAMGYKKVVTYILDTETGNSLKAAGYKCEGKAGGVEWTGKRKPKNPEQYPRQMKTRWVKISKKQ